MARKKGQAPPGWHFRGRLDGVEKTYKALKQFPLNVQKRVTRKALTKASQIVSKAAKANVPTQSKLYKKSLGYKVWTGRKSGVVMSFIGPRLGFKGTYKGKKRDPRYYAHIVEGGRKALKPKSKSVMVGTPAGAKSKDNLQWYGRHVKAARPQRPLARAFRQTKSQVESTMNSILRAGIAEEARKLVAGSILAANKGS